MLIKAHAKINLFLDIKSRRTDGYHDIISYMQSVSLADDIRLEHSDKITVSGSPCAIPEKDLAYRAASVFFAYTGIKGGADINLTKRIPVQGGLGGGSSDAAAVLRGLDCIYETKLSEKQLIELGTKLGSDVPFCICKGGCIAEGRGERLEIAPSMPSCGIVIVASDIGASTPEQFAELDALYADCICREPKTDKLISILSAAENDDISGVAENLYNIFEQTKGYDKRLAALLKAEGAEATLLCGSGSSVFGIFKSLSSAEAVAKKIRLSGNIAFACQPINKENVQL